MIMIAVLRGVLLMVILPMLLPLINGDSLILTDLHKGQNASKIVNIPSLAELPYVRQKLLQGCFNIQNMIPCSCRRSCFWQGFFDSSCLTFVISSMLWSWFSTFCHASDTICSKDKNHYAFGHAFDLVMLCSILPCFSWHILLQGQDFWVLQLIPHVLGKKLKFTIHLSLFAVTIHCHYSPVTIHSEFLPI